MFAAGDESFDSKLLELTLKEVRDCCRLLVRPFCRVGVFDLAHQLFRYVTSIERQQEEENDRPLRLGAREIRQNWHDRSGTSKTNRLARALLKKTHSSLRAQFETHFLKLDVVDESGAPTKMRISCTLRLRRDPTGAAATTTASAIATDVSASASTSSTIATTTTTTNNDNNNNNSNNDDDDDDASVSAERPSQSASSRGARTPTTKKRLDASIASVAVDADVIGGSGGSKQQQQQQQQQDDDGDDVALGLSRTPDDSNASDDGVRARRNKANQRASELRASKPSDIDDVIEHSKLKRSSSVQRASRPVMSSSQRTKQNNNFNLLTFYLSVTTL